MAELISTTTLKRGSILTAQMGEELGMMDVEAGRYYLLDDIGARIWELLEFPTTMKDLVTTLMAQYEVPEEQCRKDLEAFIGAMVEKGLVVGG